MVWSIIKGLLGQKNIEEPAERERQNLKKEELTNRNHLFKKPSKKQIEECHYLGIKVTPDMSSRDVWEILTNDIPNNQKLKQKQLNYHAIDAAAIDDDEREFYSNDLVNDLNKWMAVCDGKQYVVALKRGSKLIVDIVEFESAEIEDANKPYVIIEALRPKTYKPRGESPYMEWEKEITIKPKQIVFIEKLSEEIDMFDVDNYNKTLQRYDHLKDEATANKPTGQL